MRTHRARSIGLPGLALVLALGAVLAGTVSPALGIEPDGPPKLAAPTPVGASVTAASPAASPAQRGGSGLATPSAIEPGSVNRSSMAIEATYDVAVTLRYGAGSMSVTSAMTVTNRSGGPIDRLELNAVAARLGRIRITKVTIDGRPAHPRVADQTITVPLGGVLPDGATARVRILFHAWFRTSTTGSNWLFSRAGGVIAAYRWLPWISRPRAFERPNFGDPFVTPVSPSVRVRITTDRPMRLATSGRRVAASGLSQTFVAENVRDFVITASPSYRVLTASAGDTIVQVFYRTSRYGPTLMLWARKALLRFEALVGPYPYPTFTVAESGGGYGMEAPALVWIPRGVEASRLPLLVTHETAHQWFYAVVGNDQAVDPFADEALVDFLARYAVGQKRASRCARDTLDRTIYRYSRTCYHEVVYIQGGNLLDDLRRRMGSAAFWGAIRAYYAANRFELASTSELLATLRARTSLNLVPTLRPRFPRLFP